MKRATSNFATAGALLIAGAFLASLGACQNQENGRTEKRTTTTTSTPNETRTTTTKTEKKVENYPQ